VIEGKGRTTWSRPEKRGNEKGTARTRGILWTNNQFQEKTGLIAGEDRGNNADSLAGKIIAGVRSFKADIPKKSKKAFGGGK